MVSHRILQDSPLVSEMLDKIPSRSMGLFVKQWCCLICETHTWVCTIRSNLELCQDGGSTGRIKSMISLKNQYAAKGNGPLICSNAAGAVSMICTCDQLDDDDDDTHTDTTTHETTPHAKRHNHERNVASPIEARITGHNARPNLHGHNLIWELYSGGHAFMHTANVLSPGRDNT